MAYGPDRRGTRDDECGRTGDMVRIGRGSMVVLGGGITMLCCVCGATDNVGRYWDKRQVLCDACATDTPDKVSRTMFDRLYWGVDYETVPVSMRREFYSDYLASTDTLDEYVIATTSDE